MRISDWSSDVCSSDLLNRPFNFRDPTVVLGGRANYGDRVDKINPQFSLLATDRWDTGIGEIGALINGTSSKSDYYRASTVLFQRRRTNTGPFTTPGSVTTRTPQPFPPHCSLNRPPITTPYP